MSYPYEVDLKIGEIMGRVKPCHGKIPHGNLKLDKEALKAIKAMMV